MKDAPTVLKILNSECPDIWIRLPKHKWPKSWSSMEDPVVNLYGHPLAGLFWERQFEKVLVQHGWGKVSNWEFFSLTEKKVFSCLCMWTIYKLVGKKQNIDPMWKVLMKDVDLGEATSFLDHVFLGCTQRECQTCKDIVDNYRNMFEAKISVGATEKVPYSEKLGANICSWSYDMEGRAKKCVEGYLRIGKQTTQQLYKVVTPCIDDHQFKEEEMGSVGELSTVCSHVVLNACIWRELVDQTFYGP